MSDFFDKVVTDAKAVEEELLGPDYPYYKYIGTPAEIGMSSEGSLSATANNVVGLIDYVELMITGKGRANKAGTGLPLGDKFFLKTGAQCMDDKTQKLVDRYIWINNIPDGSIPFLTSGAGVQFTDFEGIIPGVMEDLGAMNPMAIFRGFMEGNNPPCSEICMPTVGQPPGGNSNPNTQGSSCFHVSNDDIKAIPACDFPNKVNPQGGPPCRANFTTLDEMKQKGFDTSFRKAYPSSELPSRESYNNFYIFLCGLLLIFIVQKLLKKN